MAKPYTYRAIPFLCFPDDISDMRDGPPDVIEQDLFFPSSCQDDFFFFFAYGTFSVLSLSMLFLLCACFFYVHVCTGLSVYACMCAQLGDHAWQTDVDIEMTFSVTSYLIII